MENVNQQQEEESLVSTSLVNGEGLGAHTSEQQGGGVAEEAAAISEDPASLWGEGQEPEFRIVDEGGQLSLFGFDAITSSNTEDKKDSDDCGAAPDKKSAGAKKNNRGAGRSKPTVTAATPKPVLESVKLGEGWKIHYAATTFEVDTLFEEELNNAVENVTLEEIRLKLVTEEDAAELTPSGTKWRFDVDQKQLFPDAWGQDKGAC